MSTADPAELDSKAGPPPAPSVPISRAKDAPISRLLTSRYTGVLALIGVVLGAFVLPQSGLGPSTCTMYNLYGIPCPGCGLTRSVTSTLHGSFIAAFQYNPFGYVFAACFVLLSPMAVLPVAFRERMQRALAPFERTMLVLLITFIVLFAVHGIVRGVMIRMDREPYQWWNRSNVPPAFQHLVDEEE